jgi:hypothetical protein
VVLSWQTDNDATFVGVDLCQTFSLTPVDLYYKWESILLAPNAIGQRFVDSGTPSAIRAVIQSELARAALAQGVKAEPGLRKTRGVPPVGMLVLGSRMNTKLSGVGLVDTAAPLRSQLPIPQSVGKVGTIKVAFECLDIEEVSRDKRNCACHIVRGWRPVSQTEQINICTRRSPSEAGVSILDKIRNQPIDTLDSSR